jgi:hypothetical protein
MKITLFVKSMSINSFYYANKSHGKTLEGRQWSAEVFNQLSKFAPEFAELRAKFDPKLHGYAVKLTWSSPALYTKGGLMSSGVCDLSNSEKMLIDCLFLPKNFGTNVPYQCENLNCDDRYLKSLSSRKIHGPDVAVKINIRIIPK